MTEREAKTAEGASTVNARDSFTSVFLIVLSGLIPLVCYSVALLLLRPEHPLMFIFAALGGLGLMFWLWGSDWFYRLTDR
jgi:hypothetical protein